MSKSEFQRSLKYSTSVVNSYKANTESLLKDLGLFPLPENVQAKISHNGRYLDLKLKDSNSEKGKLIKFNQHLLFQIPLQENDLSALKNRYDYQDLINRYNSYTNEYIDEIKNYALQEREFLEKRFPELVFNIKIRVKSFESYMNKLNSNILKGKSPYINDIMAERIILSEYKGCRAESVLSKMCDEVAKALYEFRINTNFRMKKDDENNIAKTNKEYVTKDYIEYPKENGYKSLHILMENILNPDFHYETQIRTFEMENLSKTCGEMAHNKYKPRLLNDLSSTRVPLYSVITQYNNSMGKPIILDAPFDMRFYHFYNTSLNNHQYNKSKRSIPITYDNYNKEMHLIEQSLGLSFKDIRQKLRAIDTKKYQPDNHNKNIDDDTSLAI